MFTVPFVCTKTDSGTTLRCFRPTCTSSVFHVGLCSFSFVTLDGVFFPLWREFKGYVTCLFGRVPELSRSETGSDATHSQHHTFFPFFEPSEEFKVSAVWSDGSSLWRLGSGGRTSPNVCPEMLTSPWVRSTSGIRGFNVQIFQFTCFFLWWALGDCVTVIFTTHYK